MQEQQQERALTMQLQQRYFTVQALMQTFKNQLEYLTIIFKKISEQQQQAHDFNQKLTDKNRHMRSCINIEYIQQQKVIAQKRDVRYAYQRLAPEIIQELRFQLKSYAQAHGEQYLNAAIKALKEESQLTSNK